MIRTLSLSTFASGAVLLSLLVAPARAEAQAPPLPESVTIGAWTFRPSVELRVRGEYRRDPLPMTDVSQAVLWEPPSGASGSTFVGIPSENLWSVGERTRLGMAVERGPVTGVLVIQDTRTLGSEVSGLIVPGGNLGALGGLSGLSTYEAYIDVHSRSGRPMFLRLGRQRVVWGDGRLLGESDWSQTPRSLDAARFGVQVSDVDIELLASLLTAPGIYSKPDAGGASATWEVGTGAQLYGLDVVWHFMPLLNVELTGLSRIVRPPTMWDSPTFTPGDTYVASARLFGDRRGFRYAVEGAYELGRVASYGVIRDLAAFAGAARASLETALPGHLTFGAQGAYASGDDGDRDPASELTRFDPILPDAFANHGAMGLYAWSNLIEAGGDVSIIPRENLTLRIGYRFAALASPEDRWTKGTLAAVGASAGNDSRALGHEVDASLTLTPWDAVEFKAGYGLFLFGDKAKAILENGDEAPNMQHWGFLQALVRAP